jgi:tripartite ATP-independent transporter DctM subunit
MFLLMGYICYYGGMTTSLFELSKALLARVPGSLAVSSIFACSGFAAVSGSSVATAAAMGRIAIPEMVRAGYDKNFACGAIAAGGTIGALIPPSVIMILFGIFAQVSIIQLFIGGIGIGLLTAASYIVVILLASWLRPDLVPRAMPTVSKDAVMASLLEMGPIILLILGVFGGLFGGIFTTTEAGAVGAGMACVIALAQRRLAWDTFFKSITETVATCGAIFVIGVGATLFTRFLSLSGTGDLITTMVTSLELGYWELMILIVVIHLVLGCFIDGIGAMLITLPIFLPILHAADLDLVWYGVFLTKMIEIGMITPPFGLNVFVIKSVVGDLTSLVGVFRGIVYFLMADLVVVFLVLAFPIIILYLPQTFGI